MGGKRLLVLIGIAGVAGLAACSNTTTTPAEPPSIASEPFGQVDGTPVTRYTLTNGHGMRVRILTYGGIIQSIEVPDRSGHVDNVVLGFATLADYLNNTGSAKTYFGAIVGRYGNRIAKGAFSLNGNEYHLPINNNGNSLHGGTTGFDAKVWQASQRNASDSVSLKLQYVSPAGEMGYPGTLTTTVTYTLNQKSELRINYHATTDAPTVINLTNHSYFNLAGEDTVDIYGQRVTIHADNYTPTDPTQIPTGQIARVQGTPFDFTSPTAIGAHITANDPQLLSAHGYDHNWVINRGDNTGLVEAAKVEDPQTGRTLTVSTTEPGVQFYTSNFLDGAFTGTSGHIYRQGAGFAMETQHYPDSPNHPNFPTTTLNPGQTYDSTTVFAFGAQ
ncbi:aldose epimerase family protein [Mycobacterium montefiorense]|uniref:Aldose 1-epimerase n=1 Tax=Mycobacterium montefiorense TaxID=154654 RepID=A0AA37PR18_9MYCO|nr:aldose epimerase family protein [Mycobacterium montefiorense]GBG36611.1 aldose 1-epimerase [Mycobacterium montefiorense]GKU36961.1 aldose 1-epimerase [Mycobacterium montefiorense]GKU43134.1 aldose 1-epimerase [Mycobacterium montefiorense]GKU48555.1 aldose 1-epimerase [Mycobacterium montefiorense]GKU50585.1 aldose 1-epimerase [Mycobacterium montefiorense]